MPGYDGTGPNGMGPMIGGGRGFCGVSGNRSGGLSRGRRLFGQGFGCGGRGYRHRFLATGLPGWARSGWERPEDARQGLSAKEEAEALKEEAEFHKREMESIQNRINELQSQEKK